MSQYIAMTTPKNRLMTRISVALWHDMLFGRWGPRLNKCKLADLGMRWGIQRQFMHSSRPIHISQRR